MSEVTQISAMSIENFCSRYGISRSATYEEIKAGRLKAVKVGRRTLVTSDAGDEWLGALPRVNARPVAA